MITIAVTYEGNLHCHATHEPSGATLQTDAPKDNRGNGACFSPTDLVGTALGTCILTVMGIAARPMGVELAGATLTVNKEMIATPVRRISKLVVDIHLPSSPSDEQKSSP